jgi:hypothetical protein
MADDTDPALAAATQAICCPKGCICAANAKAEDCWAIHYYGPRARAAIAAYELAKHQCETEYYIAEGWSLDTAISEIARDIDMQLELLESDTPRALAIERIRTIRRMLNRLESLFPPSPG